MIFFSALAFAVLLSKLVLLNAGVPLIMEGGCERTLDLQSLLCSGRQQ